MNEEEKKAIEELEEFIKGPCETCKYCEAAYKLNRKNIIQLLNLTKKLQKENKELDNDNTEWRAKYVIQLAKIDDLQKENENLKIKERSRIIEKYGDVEIHDVINRTLSNYYIPIQKVKDKIEELDKKIKYEENEKVVIYLHKQKNNLQELLEGRK